MPVSCNRYSYLLLLFVCQYSLLFVSYYSLLDSLLPFSFEFCFDCCLKRKRTILNLTLFRYFDPALPVQVHQYLLTTTCSTPSSSRVNKHHKSDSTFLFHLSFVLIVVWKEKEQFWTWPCSGISILRYPFKYISTCWLLPVQHHHHLESINIIHQTPLTLS